MKPLLQNISLILILCAVLESILPPSKGKRAFHLLCGVVIFTSLFSSLRDTDLQSLQIEDWLLPSAQSSEAYLLQQENAWLLAAKKGYESAARDVLQKASIAFSDISAQCTLENETVLLQKLTVAGIAEDAKSNALHALSSICEGAKIEWITEERQ